MLKLQRIFPSDPVDVINANAKILSVERDAGLEVYEIFGSGYAGDGVAADGTLSGYDGAWASASWWEFPLERSLLAFPTNSHIARPEVRRPEGVPRYSRAWCYPSPLGRSRSRWLTPSAVASSNSVTIVGFRRPCSKPLMYCWLKPETSASCSWVKPFSRLIRPTFRPTSLRMSMRGGERITNG
jgi:hypothetical protein